VKVAGRWRYVYRAVDQFGQVIDVLVSARRDTMAAHRFFEPGHRHDEGHAFGGHHRPSSDLPGRARELLLAAWHRTERYANNRVEADHGRLKTRLRPMRGAQAGRQRQGDHRWAWLRAEPPARTLRAGRRGANGPSRGSRLRRARGRNLIRRCVGALARCGWRNATDPPSQQGRAASLESQAGVAAIRGDLMRSGQLVGAAMAPRYHP
jgi:hypothetical protein